VEIAAVNLRPRNRVVEKYVKNATKNRQYSSTKVNQYARHVYFVIWTTKLAYSSKTLLK